MIPSATHLQACVSELVHSALMGIGVSSVGFMKELWWVLLFRPSISFSEDQESDETTFFFLTPHYDLLSVTAQDKCFLGDGYMFEFSAHSQMSLSSFSALGLTVWT